MEQTIVNRVAGSGIITIDLSAYTPDPDAVVRLDTRMHALRDIGHAVIDVGFQEFVVEQLGQVCRRRFAGVENGIEALVQRRIDPRRIGIEQLVELGVGRNRAVLEQVECRIGISERAFEFLFRHGFPSRVVMHPARHPSRRFPLGIDIAPAPLNTTVLSRHAQSSCAGHSAFPAYEGGARRLPERG